MAREITVRQRFAARANPTLLRHCDFRLLAASEVFWHLGNQFHLIALPWLVLQLTGDTLALSQVLLLSGAPRVALMPIGGGLCDRFSPRTLLWAANAGRTALLAGLAWLVLAGPVAPWMLGAFSLAYGVLEALLYPARGAIVPLLAPPAQLQQANSLVQGVEKLAGLAGPLVAGLAITLTGSAAPAAGDAWLGGSGVALAAGAAVTLVSTVLLGRIAGRPRPAAAAPALLASVCQGLAYIWRHGTLRALCVVVVAINLLTTGPLYVGLPLLAQARLAEGATALGILTAALNGGALLGTALAGVLPRPAPRRLGWVLALALATCAIGLWLLVNSSSTLSGALLVLAIGATVNYVNVTTVTWLQGCTPGPLMGRMMSLVTMR